MIHPTDFIEELGLDSNPLYILKFVTDYIECHYTGEQNLEALMGHPIVSHIYECFMTEVGELGALLADPRTYKEVMKMSDAKIARGLHCILSVTLWVQENRYETVLRMERQSAGRQGTAWAEAVTKGTKRNSEHIPTAGAQNDATEE